MGPLFVLFTWAIIAGVLSLAGGLLLRVLVALATRRVGSGRKRALGIATFLPASGFAYLFFCVMVFSVWSTMRGRDMGWGDSWDTPILGNYRLLMIDVTDQGEIYYYAGGSAISGGISPIVNGVRRLEVKPPFILGAAAPDAAMEYPAKVVETKFFILDTKDGSQHDFPTENALRTAATPILGEPLHLETVDNVYERFRYTSADLIPLVCLGVPPILAALWLGRALLRLRQTSASSGYLPAV